MFAAFFIHVVLLHAQIGSGLPLMGSTQGSTAAVSSSVLPVLILSDVFLIPADQVEVLP